MMRPHSAKLDDVARLAGVSPATVSRCLNRPESVNPEKRQRVLWAVNTLGYVAARRGPRPGHEEIKDGGRYLSIDRQRAVRKRP